MGCWKCWVSWPTYYYYPYTIRCFFVHLPLRLGPRLSCRILSSFTARHCRTTVIIGHNTEGTTADHIPWVLWTWVTDSSLLSYEYYYNMLKIIIFPWILYTLLTYLLQNICTAVTKSFFIWTSWFVILQKNFNLN